MCSYSAISCLASLADLRAFVNIIKSYHFCYQTFTCATSQCSSRTWPGPSVCCERCSDRVCCKDARRRDKLCVRVAVPASPADVALAAGTAAPSTRASQSWRSTAPSRASPNAQWPCASTRWTSRPKTASSACSAPANRTWDCSSWSNHTACKPEENHCYRVDDSIGRPILTLAISLILLISNILVLAVMMGVGLSHLSLGIGAVAVAPLPPLATGVFSMFSRSNVTCSRCGKCI